MDTIDICDKLEETTYFVNVFEGNEVLDPEYSVSTGSAVSISSGGHLLTASHVVTGRIPIKQEDINDPEVTIVAMKKGGELETYVPGLCGLTIKTSYFKEPLTVDLAILHPKKPKIKVPFLEVSRESLQLGTRVLMAGFPDDIELPFSFDRKLDPKDPEVISQKQNLRIARQLLMIKSGMIGHKSGISLIDRESGLKYEGEITYVDNNMHSGSSGGPIVNVDLKIVGIIADRAMTSISHRDTPDLKVPSGSTVAFSPRLIQKWIDEITAS